MKFIQEITIDWYDNILKSFCKDGDNKTYYCCILAINEISDEKIYLCIEIKYLKGYNKLKDFIDENSFASHWNELSNLIDVKKINYTYLVKANNLRTDEIKLVKYKANYEWPKEIIWGEYPQVLDAAAIIENWWKLF